MNGIPISQLEEKVKQLPAFEQTVRDVLSLLERGELDLSILQKKIMQDQTLMARILRVANSPFYGFAGQIATIKDACIVLGCHTIRNVVIATAVIGQFPPDESNLLDRKSLWQHAAGTGGAARALATHLNLDAESAFTAGLLHDIGKLALDTCFPHEYQGVLQYRDQQNCSIRQAEEAILGYDHALVGGLVAKHWKLPAALVEAITYHHLPSLQVSKFVEVVHLADILCHGLGVGSTEMQIPAISKGVLDHLGLEMTSISKLLPEIASTSRGAANFITVA